jgi:tRNA (cytidine/uridine-2'-O-)-methyltransferase
MFHIALFEPQIAPNTGNILRLISNNGCWLHLIEPLGFDLEEKKLRRAGLDYRDMRRVTQYPDYASFAEAMSAHRIFAVTTKGPTAYHQVQYQAGDVLLFGAETHGLPQAVHDSLPDTHRIRLPMLPDSRTLNLSNAVAIVSYEAWRQVAFSGGHF